MHARLKRFVSIRACLRQAIAAHLHAGGRPIRALRQSRRMAPIRSGRDLSSYPYIEKNCFL